jgi:transcriptional regulator with XRE-family HTH domain
MEAPEATLKDGVAEQADFVAELVRHRRIAKLSQAGLGALMGYDRTYVNKVERGALVPTAEFARKADSTLHLQGDLLRRWEDFDATKRHQTAQLRRQSRKPVEETAAALVIAEDEAWLRFDGDAYALRMRKRIVNVGDSPVTRFFIRIAVDRYPHDPMRSNDHHRRNPLSIGELALHAARDGEPMLFEVKQDRDSIKELWLLFRNQNRQFPLYPGEETSLEYSYQVCADKWGTWFQRAIRLPTRRLAVHLQMPAALDPAVWGTEVSPAAEQRPLATPVQTEVIGADVQFHWSTGRPPLEARYRLEWTFRDETSALSP